MNPKHHPLRSNRHDPLVAVCLLIGTALLVSGPSIFTTIPETTVAGILLVAGSVLLAVAIRKSLTTDLPYVGVQCLLMFAFLVHYALGGWLLWFWEYLPWQNALNRTLLQSSGARDNMPMAAYLALLGGLGLYIGAGVRFAGGMRRQNEAMRERSSLKASIVPLFLVFFFVADVIAPMVPKSIRHSADLFGSVAQLLVMFVAFIAASHKETGTGARWWIMCAVGYILLAVPSIQSGMREGFIKPLALVALGWISRRRKLPWKAALVTLGVVFFLMLPIANLAKQYSLDSDQNGIDRLTSASRNVGNRDYRSVMEDVFANALARINLLPSLAVYSKFYPQKLPFLQGETFVLETIEFAPRIFWPDKPEVGRLLDNYPRQVGIIGLEDTRTSAKFDAITEYFINFGASGVFILSALHGAFYQMLKATLQRFVSPVMAALMTGAMMVQNNDFFGFVMLTPTHVTQIVVWSGVIVLVRNGFQARATRLKVAQVKTRPWQMGGTSQPLRTRALADREGRIP